MAFGKFAIVVAAIQFAFIAIYAIFVTYDDSATGNATDDRDDGYYITHYFSFFQDIHGMIFFGIGFLLTFIKKYGYSGLTMNLMLGAISMEVALVTQNVWHATDGKIHLNMVSLISAEVAAASALIAFGALLGKVSPLQMIIFAILETVFFTVNEYWCYELFKVLDVGESVSLHVFAALFGASAAYVVDKGKTVQDNPNQYSTPGSDITCLLGTVFLWCYWPAFNTAIAPQGTQQMTALNTFLGLVGSCIMVFILSSFLNRSGKFTMTHVQNATLAGGVAVGATANIPIQPSGALAVGSIGGIASVLGFTYFQPAIAKKNIYDVCGIMSLHGIPGILGGIIGAIASALASASRYGHMFYTLYPAMTPRNGTIEFHDLQIHMPDLIPGNGRDSLTQAGFQLAYIATTVLVSTVTGLITGLILRLQFFDPLVEEDEMYVDSKLWVETQPQTTDKNNQLSIITKC